MREKTIQNTRKWFALICAIILYYLIHEGSHVIVALLYGVFEQIRILGVGVQVVAKVELLTDIQTGIFCIVGNIATLLRHILGFCFYPELQQAKARFFGLSDIIQHWRFFCWTRFTCHFSIVSSVVEI